MTWTVIPDVDVEAGGIPKGSTITAIRDNIIEAQGALKPIAEAVISSDATVDFTAFNNTRYRAYRFIIEAVQIVSAPANFEMLFSTDGGSTFQSSYAFRSIRADGDGVTFPGGTSGSQINLITGVENTSGTPYGISGSVDIIIAALALRTSFSSNLVAQEIDGINLSPMMQLTNGWSNTASDTDAVRFQLSAGNMASGTIKMYGILDALETA